MGIASEGLIASMPGTDDSRLSSLAEGPFLVEERLEQALERARARATDPVDLYLEIDQGVPDVVWGDGERLRDAATAALSGPGGAHVVRVTSAALESGRVELRVAVDASPALTFEASVHATAPRATVQELAGRRIAALGLRAAHVGLLRTIGMLAESLDTASEVARFAPDVALVDVPASLTNELGSEAAIRDRWGLGSLPLVIASDAEVAISPGACATSISRPIRRARLVSALRMVLASPAGEASSSALASRPLRVLVVDDQAINRVVVIAMLRKLGQRLVDAAAHGVEAVAACRSNAYDLVLMDLQMPILDGLGATEQILSTLPVPPRIVALTASSSEHDRAECQRVGMRGLLTKPVAEADLRDQLERAARAPRRR